MFSPQFAFVVCLVAPWLIGSLAVPLVEKEFFWFPTDKGTVIPALLKGQPSQAVHRAVEDDVVFWHYLIGEGEGREITPNCDQCLTSFVNGAPTVFFAHGFGSDHVGGFGTRLREGFANKGQPVNMVFLDWSKLAPAPWYELAANNVKPVGEYTARMMNFLMEQGVSSLDNTFFVGHSLGAHMANYISVNLANNGKLHGVFALDPALPLFGQKGDAERIDPTDADFVNVFHTAMGTLLDGGLSFTEPRGHVDFYPNSGKPPQPGCGADVVGSCSHSRAYHYLGESIANSGAFSSCQCISWEEFDAGHCPCQDQIVMGWNTPRTARGIYYLKTNGESPYSQS